jgi:hypothetical protein
MSPLSTKIFLSPSRLGWTTLDRVQRKILPYFTLDVSPQGIMSL